MKKILIVLACILHIAVVGNAQGTLSNGRSIGTVQQFLNQLQQAGSTMNLVLADGRNIAVAVKYKNKAQNEIHMQGEIAGANGIFYIDIAGGNVKGSVLMTKEKKAYTYNSDEQGNAIVKEQDIRKLMCVDFPVDEDESVNTAQKPTDDPDVSNLQSNPGAGGCLLLDFNGYEMPAGNYWNSGNAISAASAGMSNQEILNAWEIVAQDYFPFNLNVTTNETVFNTYPANKRSRCVVTPTNYFFTGCSGIAFTGSFLFNNEAPCWVFTSGTGLTGKRVGEASSHELGHTMGLSHDGGPGTDYYFGHGDWAPIMGNSLSKRVSQWSKGDYTGATNTEDDLAIIASTTNGVGYRLDDHANTNATATAITATAGVLSNTMNKGVIERTDDWDRFSFTTTGGGLALNVQAASAYTDVRLSVNLYNSIGTLVNTYTALATDLGAPIVINETLTPGTYYIAITGTAAGTADADYNDYSSLGAYNMFGSFNNAPLGVKLSLLQAKIQDAQNTLLSWTTNGEENNSGFRMERSADGKNFTEIGMVSSLAVDGNSSEKLSYTYIDTKSLAGTSYYRMVQVDIDGKTTFSNIASVTRTGSNSIELSAFPNPAKSQLNVALKGAVREGAMISITDMAGRLVWNQAVTTQQFNIDMSRFQSGIYLLKYSDNESKMVYKIMKD
jgi:hypothetical protein